MQVSFGNSHRSDARARRPGAGCALLCAAALALACSSTNKFPDGQFGDGVASGGSAGAGGSTASTGNAGTSAAIGTAGSGTAGSAGQGASNTSPGLTQVYDFETSLGGFRINYYCSDANTCVSVSATPAPSAADAGADAGDAGADAAAPSAAPASDFVRASFDPAVGNPEPGSAKIEVQFSGPGQVAEFAINPASVNLTGKTLTARITMDPGSPGGSTAKLYVKTGVNYLYADSGQITLVAGSWSTLTYSTPSYIAMPTTDYDSSDVREIGIEMAPPASPALTVLAPAVIHIDSIEY
jgi:hypothetical protein